MNTATRLRRVRRELDECAEQVERLAKSLDAPVPAKLKLVGITEAAVITGIPRSTLRTMRTRKQLPTPIAELSAGPVWLQADIERWWRGR